MKAPRTSDLLAENADLRARVAEAQKSLEAMRSARVGKPLGAGPAGQTERSAHEEELRRLNRELDNLARRRTAELQALMDALPVGVSFSDDPTCQRITGNPAVLAQFEATAADNLSASAPDSAAPGRKVQFFREGQPLTDAELPLQRAVAENRNIPPVELEVLLPSGRRWFVEVSGAPIRDQAGKVIGGVAVTADISARKQAEAALRESHERMKKVLAVDAVGMMFWDLNTGCLVDANDTFLKLMGYSRRDLESRTLTWQKFTPPEYHEVSLAEIRKFQATGRVGPYEKEYFRKDGTRQWFLFSGSSLGNNRCVEFCVDISDRKKVEAALRESEARVQVAEAVRVERQRLAEVLNMLPAYVILLSPDYRVPFANRFFEQRFGKSEGRRCYEYLFNRTEPCENCETFKVLKSNAPHRWEWTGPDGRNYDIHDFPFRDVDGSPLIMEVGLDITERKRAEGELLKHRERLQELVNERTAGLSASNEELVRFNRAMVGRELRMIELKQEINDLCARLGQPPRYAPGAEAEPMNVPKAP